MATEKSQELCPFTRLADGSLIVWVSVQRRWVYARIVLKGGHTRTRRYRWDQDVPVEPKPTDPAA